MPKTTIQVRSKKWDLFNKECKATSMRRDDFLNRTLPSEVEILEKIPPCDETGESWLKRNWLAENEPQDAELQAVSLNISESVIASLNKVCKEKRIPRDAFIDCVLTYLTNRIYEAAIVIKNPRTSADLVSCVAHQHNDPIEGIDNETHSRWMLETVKGYTDKRDLTFFNDNFYQTRLSFNKARVEEVNFWRDEVKELRNKPATLKGFT